MLPLKAFVPHSAPNINNQWTDILPTIMNSFRPIDLHIHLNFTFSFFDLLFCVNDCNVYIFLVILYIIPSLFSSTHPHTLIHMSHSHLYISDHIIPLSHYTSSHFSLYHTNTTIITSLTSYYSTRHHNTSQLTHHHINTMTTSHSPADDSRKNSSESSCYAYIYCYFYMFTRLYKSLKYKGGSNPIFAHGKMCVFPFFPMRKNGKKSIWKEREKYSFPSLSIYFFPFFPM